MLHFLMSDQNILLPFFEVNPKHEIGYGVRKGSKAYFLSSVTLDVKDEVQSITGSLPHAKSTVYLIDAMEFCQRNKTLGAKTFGDFFTDIYITNSTNNFCRLHSHILLVTRTILK